MAKVQLESNGKKTKDFDGFWISNF